MEKKNVDFLTILKAALHDESAELREALSREEWIQVIELAKIHDVLPLVYDAVYRLPVLQESAVLASVKAEVIRQVTIQTMKTEAFLALNRHLRSAGGQPLVVKGIICRSLYPKPDYRQSSDEDVLIPADTFDLHHRAMLSFGMQMSDPEMDAQAAYEVPYGKSGSPVYIELHKHLFPPQSEAYGDLNRFFEGVFDRAVEESIREETVLTMAPTDHLFYLICHSFKHFLHSGFGIRQVCDIVLFVNRYANRIDWEQVLENCRQIRAERFAVALLNIGEKYLGFALPAAYPQCWRELEADEGPMLEDLLDSGIFGDADKGRKHSSTITLTAVEDQKQGKKRQNGVIKSLFPSAESIQGRYPYLKERPWLLPVAWGSRIIKYGSEMKNSGNAADAVKIGNRRVELLKQYGILDE